MRKFYLMSLLALLLAIAPPEAKAGVSLPYYCACSSTAELNALPGTTPNGTQKWNYYSNGFRVSRINASTVSNASVFFPEVDFKPGCLYKITLNAKVQNTTVGKVRIFLATAEGEPGSLTFTYDGDEIGSNASVPRSTWTPFTFEYTPTEAKTRYVAVNNNSPGGSGIFYFQKFRIEEYSLLAPAAVDDLEVLPDASGRKQATVKFTAPTKTYGGDDLTGTFDVQLKSGETLITTFSGLTAGQKVEQVVNFPQATSYTLTALSVNSTGNGGSVEADLDLGSGYTGADHKWNGGLHYLVYAKYTDGKVTLDWSKYAVEGATYTVTRYPDKKEVATELEATTVDDEGFLTDAPIMYYYVVNAVTESATTKVGTSNAISLNNTVPYGVYFDSAAKAYEWTNFDIDGTETQASSGCTIEYNNLGYYNMNNRNDWTITPGIKMEAGKYYKLTTNAWSSHGSVGMGLSYGKNPYPEAMDTEIMPLSWISNTAASERYLYFNVPETGQYFVGIHSANPDDTYTYNMLRFTNFTVEEVSENLPDAVTDIVTNFDKVDTTKAVLTFKAPAKNIAGKQLEALTKIDIYKDDVLFKTLDNPTPGAECSIDIEVANGVQNIYKFVPFTAEGEGVTEEMGVMIIEPPYTNNFTASDALDGYTIIDGGMDGYGWGLNTSTGVIYCYPGFDQPMDEWLITPPIHLEAGQYYKTQFSAYLDRSTGTEKDLELWLGDAPTVEAMTTNVIPLYGVTGTGSANAVLLKEYFTVAEAGEYYLGFHATNPSTSTTSSVDVDNFSISAAIDPGVPGPATDLKISPDWNGELKGVIKFTTPTKTIAGETLEELTGAVLYRDGVAVHTFSNPAIGSELEFEDSGMTEGVHLYTVYCKNSKGTGRETEDIAFFGINRPSYPTNIQVTENPENWGEVTITWDAPTLDYDGFPINPDLITYEVFKYDSTYGEIQQGTDIEGLSYTFTASTTANAQQYLRFGVRAYTTAGGSPGALASYAAIGEPYTLPYLESFANYSPTSIFVQQNIDGGGYASWGYNATDPAGVEPVDGDNGMALMEAIFSGASSGLITGKIELNDDAPKLTFFLYNDLDSNTINQNLINVQVSTIDNPTWVMLHEPQTVNELCDGLNGWQKITYDLSAYKNQVVRLAFVSEAVTHVYTEIDRIRVVGASDNDLSIVEFSLPDEAYACVDYNVGVTIRNNGSADESGDYTVNLFRNDSLIEQIEGTALPKGEKITLNFTENHSTEEIEAAGREYTYYASVSIRRDGDTFDNVTNEKTLYFEETDYPGVENLTAEAGEPGSAVLNWEIPTIPEESTVVTDDLESYPSWSTMNDRIGGWTMIDNDRCAIAGINGIDMPGIELGSKQAFFLMDFSEEGFANFNATQDVIRYCAHSGNKCFAAMSLYDPLEAYADDWLISPKLSGEAQTISFYAKSIISTRSESFQIYYSTGGATIRDFVNIASVDRVPDEYTYYEYELPAGTKYFAIRRFTYYGFLFMVDDLTFRPAGNEQLVVNGYNVYREDELIGKGVESTTYTDTELEDGTHNYSVAPLYNLGEGPKATVSVETSAAGMIKAREAYAYGKKGEINIVGADGLNIDVYSADGKVIARTQGNAHNVISVDGGVYIVKLGEKIIKVNVE